MSHFEFRVFIRKSAFVSSLVLLAIVFLSAPIAMNAQANDPTAAPVQETQQPHGRKYKAPPVTSHIEVLVTGGYQSKPITNAAVIFHPLNEYGKDEGSYEVKTDPDGKAVIDVIPQGSTVILQVIAPNFATYGENYLIKDINQSITVKLQRPREQYSTYTTEHDKAADIKPGVIEPAKPVVPQPPPTAGALPGSAAASPKRPIDKDLTGITTPAVNTAAQANAPSDATATSANPTQPQQSK